MINNIEHFLNCFTNSDELIKGVYLNNLQNRKLGRVGRIYGKQSNDLSHVKYNFVTSKELSQIPETIDLHKKDNKWTIERQKLHNNIKEKFFIGKTPVAKPKAILLAGGGGSGKSFVFKKYIKDNIDENHIYLNSDDVKEAIPEYSQLLKTATNAAAGKVHEESSEIIKSVKDRIINNSYNLVYDAVLGNSEKTENLINKLKANGYDVELHFVDTEESIAIRNANERAERSGRFIKKQELQNANYSARNNFNNLKNNKQLSKIVKYDNSKSVKGMLPTIENLT